MEPEKNEYEIYAHICGERKQTLLIHSLHASELCRMADAAKQFPTLAYLAGLLHDMGKGTKAFQEYLQWASEHPGQTRNHQDHAATGAIYCWERWKDRDLLTAQILALCICSHHTGLPDCIDTNEKKDVFTVLSEEKDALHYKEAVQNFESGIMTEEELDRLFLKASEEVFIWKRNEKPSSFDAGAVVRMLLSLLVDADRWDSACFEYGEEPLSDMPSPDWDAMLACFQAYMAKTFTGASELDRLRAEISDICAERAEAERGIYRLSVPTGGGKTFSSLRFALLHARKHGMKRIFYIIPYNTILDQNVEDIQTALGESVSVLVHHSNVVRETEEDETAYRRLTERWDSEIILTSLVQFLNACFLGKNSSTRRMKQLSDAVLIFDEIQVLPRRCRVLFEKAVSFLVKEQRCTAVLCTATQPEAVTKGFVTTELTEQTDALYEKLKRVRYLPELEPELDNDSAAARLRGILDGGRSVLCVVNTKRAAWDIFEKTRNLLAEEGWVILSLSDDMTEEELKQKVSACSPREILCVHLSTVMCPAHRLKRLHAVKIWTKAGKPVLCVSTALIEAGINVSFPVVVRSLAGLPSVIQAGGRCNRNMEISCGDVYLWRLSEEKDSLKYLPDIQEGANIVTDMLRGERYRNTSDALGMPETVREYFMRKALNDSDSVNYPFKDDTLVNLLSVNKKLKQAVGHWENKAPASLPLKQSFRTVGEAFRVIDEDTTGVLVPFGEGKALIEKLCGKTDMKERRLLLRRAQAYSAALYPQTIMRLTQVKALFPVGDTGVFALREEYYDRDGGVKLTPSEMESMIL